MPFVFEVGEEYAKAWTENNVAANGVTISVAFAAVTNAAAAAVDEL